MSRFEEKNLTGGKSTKLYAVSFIARSPDCQEGANGGANFFISAFCLHPIFYCLPHAVAEHARFNLQEYMPAYIECIQVVRCRVIEKQDVLKLIDFAPHLRLAAVDDAVSRIPQLICRDEDFWDTLSSDLTSNYWLEPVDGPLPVSSAIASIRRLNRTAYVRHGKSEGKARLVVFLLDCRTPGVDKLSHLFPPSNHCVNLRLPPTRDASRANSLSTVAVTKPLHRPISFFPPCLPPQLRVGDHQAVAS